MRKLYKNQFDKQRRDFMATVAKAGLANGLVKSFGLASAMMMSRSAQAAGGPSKVLMIYFAGGAIRSQYLPSGNSTKPKSKGYSDEGVVGDINFLDNAKLTNAGHGQMWGRFGSGYSDTSFDVVVGRTVGANHPLAFLNVGVEQTSSESISRERNKSVPTINDPRTAFSRLSSALSSGGGGGGGNAPAVVGNGATSPRRLFVDLHKDAIGALRSKLGQHEKEKLDSHTAAIERIEADLKDDGGGGGMVAAPVAEPVKTCGNVSMPGSSGSGFTSKAQLQMDIAILALSCNITASASIAFGRDQNDFLIPSNIYSAPLHSSHHDNGWQQKYILTARYMAGLAAKTVKKAKSAGILNETVITQVSDMGNGNLHTNDNVPMFVAGAGVRKGRTTNIGGKNQANVYATVANIIGADAHPNFSNYKSIYGSPADGIAG